MTRIPHCHTARSYQSREHRLVFQMEVPDKIDAAAKKEAAENKINAPAQIMGKNAEAAGKAMTQAANELQQSMKGLMNFSNSLNAELVLSPEDTKQAIASLRSYNRNTPFDMERVQAELTLRKYAAPTNDEFELAYRNAMSGRAISPPLRPGTALSMIGGSFAMIGNFFSQIGLRKGRLSERQRFRNQLDGMQKQCANTATLALGSTTRDATDTNPALTTEQLTVTMGASRTVADRETFRKTLGTQGLRDGTDFTVGAGGAIVIDITSATQLTKVETALSAIRDQRDVLLSPEEKKKNEADRLMPLDQRNKNFNAGLAGMQGQIIAGNADGRFTLTLSPQGRADFTITADRMKRIVQTMDNVNPVTQAVAGQTVKYTNLRVENVTVDKINAIQKILVEQSQDRLGEARKTLNERITTAQTLIDTFADRYKGDPSVAKADALRKQITALRNLAPDTSPMIIDQALQELDTKERDLKIEGRAIIGEAYLNRLNVNFNGKITEGGYVTKQYGVYTNYYLYMKFDGGKWKVALGQNAGYTDAANPNEDIKNYGMNSAAVNAMSLASLSNPVTAALGMANIGGNLTGASDSINVPGRKYWYMGICRELAKINTDAAFNPTTFSESNPCGDTSKG